MTNNGYIQLYWKTTEWIYWEYDVGLKLFIYLLLTANWKESVFRGKRIPRGSLAISMRRMVNDCGHSEKTVRKWLERFALEGQVEVEPTNQYTVIKIVNYERYQDPSSGIGRYIKLSRSLLEWKYWHSDKAVKCWIYLLLSAGREGNECDVVCEKACEIARKCFLDEEEVHKWFEQFAADGQIELNDINGIAHIKILNFFGYQGLQTRTEQCNEQGTERCTERGTERGTERCTERGTERGTDIIRLLKSEKNKKTNKN